MLCPNNALTSCAFGLPDERRGLNDSSVVMGGLFTMPADDSMWAVFTKRPRQNMGPSWPSCSSCCWGIAKWSPNIKQFVPQAYFPLTSPFFGKVTSSTAFVHQGFIYFSVHGPGVRVPATKEAVTNLTAYELVQCPDGGQVFFKDMARAAVQPFPDGSGFVLIAEAAEPYRGSIYTATSTDVCKWSALKRVAAHETTNSTF